MSTRTHAVDVTNQIIDILEKRPRSFRELSSLVHENDEELSRHVNNLVNAGVLSIRFHDHHVTYSLARHTAATRLLHRLEKQLQQL